MKKQADYMVEIGNIIAMARTRKDMTQAELAKIIGTSQSAINRIEHGKQNASLEIISKISRALNYQIISINESATQGFRINGGKELHGSVTINTSKNAAVGLTHKIQRIGTLSVGLLGKVGKIQNSVPAFSQTSDPRNGGVSLLYKSVHILQRFLNFPGNFRILLLKNRKNSPLPQPSEIELIPAPGAHRGPAQAVRHLLRISLQNIEFPLQIVRQHAADIKNNCRNLCHLRNPAQIIFVQIPAGLLTDPLQTRFIKRALEACVL